MCKDIKEAGMKVGIALKPKTQVDDKLKNLIDNNLVDMVLVMTVGMKVFLNCFIFVLTICHILMI